LDIWSNLIFFKSDV